MRKYIAFLKKDKEKDKILSSSPNMLMTMWVMSANFDAEKASEIPFILNELKSNRKLCKFLNISEVLTADQVYKIFSEINSEKLIKSLNRILNSRNMVKRRGKKTFIVDATPVDLDINFRRNKKSKEHLRK